MGAYDYLSLYDLFVNKVFGDVWFATFGLFALFILLALLMRMSFLTALTIGGLFVVAFTSASANAWPTLIVVTVAIIYLFFQAYRYFNAEGYT